MFLFLLYSFDKSDNINFSPYKIKINHQKHHRSEDHQIAFKKKKKKKEEKKLRKNHIKIKKNLHHHVTHHLNSHHIGHPNYQYYLQLHIVKYIFP